MGIEGSNFKKFKNSKSIVLNNGLLRELAIILKVTLIIIFKNIF